MKTIWKYELQVTDWQTINIPRNAEILTIQNQNGIPQLWAIVDTDEKAIELKGIEIYGTGNPMRSDGLIRKYIGTFQMLGGKFIGHCFEIINPT
jgi:hypothetical protein